jgi:NTP pyrophosphatase (non-canonical NTP hydrolase)
MTHSEGHNIARTIIKRHGVDRYPGLAQQVLKLVAEVGELAEAVLTGSWLDSYRELGQVGVTLHLVADKLDQLEGSRRPVDVLDAMMAAVDTDTRKHNDGRLRHGASEVRTEGTPE